MPLQKMTSGGEGQRKSLAVAQDLSLSRVAFFSQAWQIPPNRISGKFFPKIYDITREMANKQIKNDPENDIEAPLSLPDDFYPGTITLSSRSDSLSEKILQASLKSDDPSIPEVRIEGKNIQTLLYDTLVVASIDRDLLVSIASGGPSIVILLTNHTTEWDTNEGETAERGNYTAMLLGQNADGHIAVDQLPDGEFNKDNAYWKRLTSQVNAKITQGSNVFVFEQY